MAATGTTNFSTNDEVITNSENTPQTEVEEPHTYFEIQRCIEFINNGDYKSVVLQFPDELMSHSTFVHGSLTGMSGGTSVYVLGDTSYGSCCVDEVAASHVAADSIIHFGQSCMSSTHRLPVLFVFGREEFEVDELMVKMKAMCGDEGNNKVVLFYDVSYHHCVDSMRDELLASFPDLVITSICADNELATKKMNCLLESETVENEKTVDNINGCDESVQSCFGRSYSLKDDMSNYLILFVGGETLLLRNLVFKFNRNKVLSYNPRVGEIRLENKTVNRSLMKRFYLIEKAKDACIVGIILGTLGVSRYRECVARLKKVLKHSGKKFYTFVIGKINVPKMANFMEIDVFVLVACPENSLIDSKEFYKPILTPYEMEIACLETREWTGEYVTEFSEVLPGSRCHVEIDGEKRSDEPEYSLITGQLRTNPNCSNNADNDGQSCRDVIECNKDTAVQQYSAERFLAGRSWTGLEVNSGQTEVKGVEEGRSGIAMSYRNEPERSQGSNGGK